MSDGMVASFGGVNGLTAGGSPSATLDMLGNALGHSSGAELLKAMSIGNDFPAGIGDINPGQVMATVPQDLDPVLKNQSFELKRTLKVYNALSTAKAASTVHQFVRQHAPGTAGQYIFHGEGGMPVESDSNYSLEQVKMAYAGSIRRLSLQSRLVPGLVGDRVRQENENGSAELLMGIERGLLWGDPACNPFEFEGLNANAHREGLIYDLQGAVPTESFIDGVMSDMVAAPNYADPDMMWCSPNVKRTLRQVYAGRMRSMLGASFTPSYILDGMRFEHNDEGEKVRIQQHQNFIRENELPVELGEGPDANKRPLSPVIVGAVAVGADAASKFTAAGPTAAGSFFYRVVARNSTGASIPSNVVGAVVIAAGEASTITIADPAPVGSPQRASSYRIYRTVPSGAQASAVLIKEIPAAAAGNTTFIDRNLDLPGTSTVFISTMNPNAIKWIQLLPMFNFPLGNVDLNYRWALLIFGALQFGSPRHHAIIKNVAPDSQLITQDAASSQIASERPYYGR